MTCVTVWRKSCPTKVAEEVVDDTAETHSRGRSVREEEVEEAFVGI